MAAEETLNKLKGTIEELSPLPPHTNQMHNNAHVQAWVDFFLAYGQKQALMGEYLSAQTELERKTRALYPSLAKQYGDDMPSKIVVDSPYGSLLLTIDTSREMILKIEEVTKIENLPT